MPRRGKLTATATKLPQRPEPPADLSESAASVWRLIVKEYPPKHFKGANLILLETFCRARAFVTECDREIEEKGLLIDGKRNPVVAMRASGWAEMRACATKLRLALSSTLRAESAAAKPNDRHGLEKPWEMA